MTTFNPTHVLVSRTRETPVQLVASPRGYWLYTEAESQRDTRPAFEMRPKLGFYCRDQQVVGFRLQPLHAKAVMAKPNAAQVTQLPSDAALPFE